MDPQTGQAQPTFTNPKAELEMRPAWLGIMGWYVARTFDQAVIVYGPFGIKFALLDISTALTEEVNRARQEGATCPTILAGPDMLCHLFGQGELPTHLLTNERLTWLPDASQPDLVQLRMYVGPEDEMSVGDFILLISPDYTGVLRWRKG